MIRFSGSKRDRMTGFGMWLPSPGELLGLAGKGGIFTCRCSLLVDSRKPQLKGEELELELEFIKEYNQSRGSSQGNE